MNQSTTDKKFADAALTYIRGLQRCFTASNLKTVESLAQTLLKTWTHGHQVYICGNGGSAANAIHIANDLNYGVGACGPGKRTPGLRVEALTANTGVITCLANDTGYENIFAHQLEVKGRSGDLLIALSGSGNSINIVRAIETAKSMEIPSFAIVGFCGGRCKEIADSCIHIEINDMQIAEDAQLIIGHICMQWLCNNKPNKAER